MKQTDYVLPSAPSLSTHIFQICTAVINLCRAKANTSQAAADAYRFTPMGSYQVMFIVGGIRSTNKTKGAGCRQ